MSLGIKKEDAVVIIAGKEKGKKGRVLAVNRDKHQILVEKINIIKKHMKPNKKYSQGGIMRKRRQFIYPMSSFLPCAARPMKVAVTVLRVMKA
jgi:large subunit ribosomal protein L24